MGGVPGVPRVSKAGFEMRISYGGSGPPLIVIPGVQGRWEWMRPALAALQKRCTTISYSLTGDPAPAGADDPAKGFERHLEQLDNVFAQTRLARAAICGVSYGGFIALRYAATRPERVSALVLSSAPSPGWMPSEIQSAYIASPWRTTPKFIATSPLRIWPEITATFAAPRARIAFLARYALQVAAAPMIPALMARRVVEQQSIDFAPDCARVQAPTLIVTGEPQLDKIVPVESTRRYLSMIAGSRYVSIERTGHLGLVTRPEVFARIIGDFLEETQNLELRTQNADNDAQRSHFETAKA
jgi:3-oxoadipate enol-lactonase